FLMKKITLKGTLFLAASALALTSVVSCSDYTEFTEGEIKQDLYNKKYDEAFIQQFGQPDPNHDWGMDEHVGYIEAFSGLSTRAAGHVNPERNMWTKYHEGTGKPAGASSTNYTETFPTYNNAPKNAVPKHYYDTDALGHNIEIPGWPHLNGLYYTANGNVLGEAKTDVNSGELPAGDVTPYEIQYVSWWFRTHKITNPQDYRAPLHLSDFFIQNVSSDNDQFYYNADADKPYETGWMNTGNNGPNLVSLDDVRTAENTNNKKAVNGDPYTTNLTEPINYSLDELGFQSIDGDWTHVNNFNAGNSNKDPENNKSNPNRMIMYVTSSGTENFRCHPSWGTNSDTYWIDSWVLVHLSWNETVKDPKSPYPQGTVIPRDGYYLAFDFQANKGTEVVRQDGYYSNWIIKITPGHFTPTGKSKRIFCEDLGGSFDWDFNDAVIDVAFEKKSNTEFIPIINVQAAGGTMPIFVEKQNEKYELHRMLGKKDSETNYVPTNVGTGRNHTIATYRGNSVSEDKAGKIHIFVNNTKNNLNYQIAGSDKTGDVDANGNTTSVETSGGTSTLNSSTHTNKTVAPSSFCAPTSVKWTTELNSIELAYEKFPLWVADRSELNWYNTVSPNAPLVVADNTQLNDGPTGGGREENISWDALTPDATEASRTTAYSAHADSYLRIEGYSSAADGQNSIFSRLDEMGAEDRVTFVAVLSSSTEFNQDSYTQNGQSVTVTPGTPLQGILVPADIDASGNMSYKGTQFTTSTFSRFVNANYVPGNTEFGTGNKTYTLEFGFRKSELLKMAKDAVGNDTGKDIYHEYVLLFLKIGQSGGVTPVYFSLTDNATYTVSDNKLTTEIHGVTIHKWYVHY
ncbi:MAG: hypothetical protein KBT29_07385, partial [Prevotellaceae bacterium]|nr:hypothetical protein [Candidatus Minthosoma caballi]